MSKPDFLLVGNKRYVPVPRLWRVNHDKTSWRPNEPEVYRLDPDLHVVITESIQRLWRGLNPQLTDEQWSRCLGNGLAFTNKTGFPGRHDYINKRDVNEKDPAFDQMRVMGGAFLAGTPVDDRLAIDAIDTRKPIPSVEYVKARPWLWFEAVNVDWSADPRGIVIRPFKGGWGVPVYVPVLISTDASYPLELLTEVDTSQPLPSAYRYP